MSKHKHPKHTTPADDSGALSHDAYAAELRVLQVELVRMQRQIIRKGEKLLVLLEGRDAAGKDGAIKRIFQYLRPRETRVVALGKPSSRERTGWYFQRWVPHLPVAQEFVLFNRSWYNRAGVEPVMGFCTPAEYREFLQSVPLFESMLVNSGVRLLKFYLDVGKAEQTRRLAERERGPLKQWKRSPVDAVALKHWKAYSNARDSMLLATHSPHAPWHIVRADDKRAARLNLMRSILCAMPHQGKRVCPAPPDPEVAYPFSPEVIEAGRLAR
jgi:polyphosphate kinase 2